MYQTFLVSHKEKIVIRWIILSIKAADLRINACMSDLRVKLKQNSANPEYITFNNMIGWNDICSIGCCVIVLMLRY